MDDGSYWQDWCAQCGQPIWFGQGYCSDECRWKYEGFTPEQIQQEKEEQKKKAELAPRVLRATLQYERLVEDDAAAAKKQMSEVNFVSFLSEQNIDHLINGGRVVIPDKYVGVYESVEYEISVRIVLDTDIEGAGNYGVSEDIWSNKRYVSLYVSRLDFIKMVKNPERVPAMFIKGN